MIKPRHLLFALCASAAMLVSLPNYAAENTAACSFPVKINQANADQFHCLSGVGARKANNIVEYRTQRPEKKFASLDELTKVKGINATMVNKWKQEGKVEL